MRTVTVALYESESGVQWVWFDADGVAWMGIADDEEAALQAAADSIAEWERHVH